MPTSRIASDGALPHSERTTAPSVRCAVAQNGTPHALPLLRLQGVHCSCPIDRMARCMCAVSSVPFLPQLGSHSQGQKAFEVDATGVNSPCGVHGCQFERCKLPRLRALLLGDVRRRALRHVQMPWLCPLQAAAASRRHIRHPRPIRRVMLLPPRWCDRL